MGAVWHGHFVKFFEDGREAFGKEFGFGYMDIFDRGYMVPLVKVECSYKKFLRYEDEIQIETRFINTAAAKIILQYTISNLKTGEINAEGETVQVFIDKNNELVLMNPVFYIEWKKKWGLDVI
jgi:acyl-CoA thioester hydrolase